MGGNDSRKLVVLPNENFWPTRWTSQVSREQLIHLMLLIRSLERPSVRLLRFSRTLLRALIVLFPAFTQENGRNTCGSRCYS